MSGWDERNAKDHMHHGQRTDPQFEPLIALNIQELLFHAMTILHTHLSSRPYNDDDDVERTRFMESQP
jgi:hypothetical protein